MNTAAARVAAEPRIRQLAADALRLTPDSISAQRIEHGLTNDSWIAHTTAGEIVIRLNTPLSLQLGIDRRSEHRVLEAVAYADLGPRVVSCDLDQGVLITWLLRGQSWSMEFARDRIGIARLASFLRELHALEVPDGVAHVDLDTLVSNYLATLNEAGISEGSPSRRAQARAMAAVLRADLKPCLCHNDVHHLNIVDDGRVRLLDWEYAGCGDPYFDLAGVCCYHNYDEQRREQLLQHYLSRPDTQAPVRLAAACWLFDYVRDLWQAVRDSSR